MNLERKNDDIIMMLVYDTTLKKKKVTKETSINIKKSDNSEVEKSFLFFFSKKPVFL